MDAAVEKSARGQHHGACAERNAHLRDGADHAIAFDHQVVDGLLEQAQVRLVFQAVADRGLVQHAVGLRPRGAHGRALSRIEDAELDARLVGGNGHRAAERVDLLHEVALADAADRRVAAHLPQRLDVVGEQQRLGAHACGSERGFGAGMATADDDHIEFFGVQHWKKGAHHRRVRGAKKGTNFKRRCPAATPVWTS
ncbi:hypothetical protein D9M69_560210 [compost metagenome]